MDKGVEQIQLSVGTLTKLNTQADAVRRQVQPIAARILEARRIRRSPEKRGKIIDPLHVVMLGLRRELPDRHVFDHAPA